MAKSFRPLQMLLLAIASLSTIAGVSSDMVPETVPQALADSLGAKQLDGSAPIYLIRRNPASTKWLLFLEGGGWCFGPTAESTIASCAGRAGFKPSSDTQKESRLSDPADYGGILGENCTTNPDFCEWNFVFLHYKDGASFGSNRVDPIMVKNGKAEAKMWMRGRPSFNAIIAHLHSAYGMTEATEVILSGGSAGGLAVFYNLDHLGSLLGPNVKLTGMPDAGFFLDAQDTSGVYSYRNNFIGADPVWNVTGSGGTNIACLAANPTEKWKCLMAQYIVPHLKTPIYVMNSAYDAYQLPNIRKSPCPVSTASKPCNQTDALAYGALFKQTVRVVLETNPANGVFVDSCFVHEQNVNYCSNQGIPNCVGWTPAESGAMKWGYTTAVKDASGQQFTPQQAFSQYYFKHTNNGLIDSDLLQQNPTCIFTGHPKM
eukprot:m.92926 g.92926  ORF g.92926 m.92926 type:complete len:430 (-) comp26585_c1_seq1:267-1556(-)